ncbi:MAG: ATP-dependent helicase [Actinobacteria bacterium]|nr:ATP-dependent helicase [Actinomycetota bacterium]
MKVKYSALDIAKKISAVDPSFKVPTAEQIPIIESPLAPAVVIAGAGSGKTETMSQRVLFLVANELITPNQLLGLTFTRKAAGELAKRIKYRLRQLKKANLLPDHVDESELTVSTYHSYAGKVLAEHAIRIGVDAESDPIGEAAAWQIAHEEVTKFVGSDLPINGSTASVVQEVMDLSTQLAENDKSAPEIIQYTNRLLDQISQFNDRQTVAVSEFKAELRQRLAILPIVDAFDNRRKESGLLTFNDHMSIAARLVSESKLNHSDDIGVIERGKYKVVLLDEYQDTSFNQIKFLSNLYGNNHPVTAVGDPNQAIYGWRSASSETLDSFSKSFNSKALKFNLMTTWRNEEAILQLANSVIDQISTEKQIAKLTTRPGAKTGEVICAVYETQVQEGAEIASYFASKWFDKHRQSLPDEKKSTFAVLVRNRSQIDLIQSAFSQLNIPTDVVGVGGLINTPEVADIIALLRTLTMPDSGTALMRLLTGPYLNLGARDLMALGSFTKAFARENEYSRGTQLKQALEEDIAVITTSDEFAAGSIIESLEQLLTLTEVELKDYRATPAFTDEGLARLRKFALSLRSLRRNLNGSITEAIIEVCEFLSLDTEVLVRDGWQNGRKNIDRFLDEAARFQKNGGSLFNFLQWLKIAEEAEGGLKPAEVDVRSDAVQILTIHAAKGAEWDYVAIPGLAERSFPNSGKKSDNWITNAGSIPVSMRGDYQQLPAINFDNFTSNKSLKAGIENFSEQWKSRKMMEEMRLAYVAITRAKQALICTTSHFRTGENVVKPSRLFQLFAAAVVNIPGGQLIVQDEIPDGINPMKENPTTAHWPRQLNEVSTVQKVAAAVESSQPFTKAEVEQMLSSLQDEERIGLLNDLMMIITELKTKDNQQDIVLPTRLSVSTLLYLADDPQELALRLRRPMPNHIDKYARRGTEFHLWLENHFKQPSLISMDELFNQGLMTQSDEDAPLDQLQKAWLASKWADRQPVAVEVGFETMIDTTLIRGRIDAVYQISDQQYEVVDWKTGKVKSGEDLASAAIQLAMYRLAYAKLKNIPIENISAAFHYVIDNQTVRPADILGERELIELVSKIPIQI